MAAEEEVVILARLAGTTEFIRNAEVISGSTREMGVAAEESSLSMEHFGRRSYLMNQALFTMRRLLYGATLAFIGGGIAAVKWGFDFNSAMQQARVALQPVSASLGGVNHELDYLFNFTKYTPFQFKDVTIAFRQMFAALHPLGISVGTVNTTLHALVDALAYAGKTSPTNLQRVSLALQHMAYQGRLTGYAVNQLARDGVPIFQALRKELGLTGDQLHTVATLGIPANVVLKALNSYIESTPGFANAAYRQATGSLHGLFTTFKDNISQLMGNMETGVFHRFQQRLVVFNAFFGRISDQLRTHASFSTVVGDAFGGTAEFIWKQFAADISLAWHIFTGFIADVFRSKSTWAIIISALVILHGLLIPINYAVQHFGGALNVLIPLFVAWITFVKVWNTLEKIRLTLLALDAGETEGLALKQVLYNNAIRASILIGNGWTRMLGIWSVLTQGYVRGAGGQFRAMTAIEKIALRLRTAFIAMFAPLVSVVTESWLWTAALEANPIIFIITAIVLLTAGLVVLYFRWKRFHDAVNSLVRFLWRNPLVAMFVPVVGPLIAMFKTLTSIYQRLKQIYDLARHPLRAIHGGGGGWLGGLENFGRSFLPFGGHVPGLAGGGSITAAGTVLVGESGPELMTLPAGAQVDPLNLGNQTGQQGQSGPAQPVVIQFVVGKRIMEQVMVDIFQGRVSAA